MMRYGKGQSPSADVRYCKCQPWTWGDYLGVFKEIVPQEVCFEYGCEGWVQIEPQREGSPALQAKGVEATVSGLPGTEVPWGSLSTD